GHFRLQARERRLLLRAATAALGVLVGLLDQQKVERRVLRRRHPAEVPRLVDLAELDLAVAEDLAVALRPAEAFFERAHLEEQRRGRQLVLTAIRTALGRALPVAKHQARARLAR